MSQSRTEATLASTGGGGASGIWGISDATGTYTYYNTIALANAAASAGDTIELFANVVETGIVQMTLVADVTYQLNGYTYTLDNSDLNTNTLTLTGINAGQSAKILNGTFVRKGTPSAGFNASALNATSGGTLYLEGVVFTSEVTNTAYVTNGSYVSGGTFINTSPTSVGFNYALYLTDGTVSNANIYSIGGYAARVQGTGKLLNSNAYSQNLVAIYSSTSAAGLVANCTAHSDGQAAISQGSSLAKTYNCYGYSSANDGIYVFGKIYDCTGHSASNYGIHCRLNSSHAYNCTAVSETGYALYTHVGGAGAYNSHLFSRINYAFYGKGNMFNCTLTNEWNSSIGHVAFAVVDGTTTNKFFNNTFEPYFTNTYCINASAAINVHYGGNTFNNTTTPINTTFITQAQVNTEDNFGNIIVG